jgi:hypothetical protein
MNKQFKKEKLLLTIYSYITTAFLGWQIVSFSSVYFQLSEKKIQYAFSQWIEVQTVYFPIAAFFLIVFFILLFTSKNINSKKFPLNYFAFKKQFVYLFILVCGILINYVLNSLDNHQNFIELLNLVFAVLCLNKLSKVFYIAEKLAWNHPTTQSTFYISAGLLGISQILILQLFEAQSFEYIILLLLIIEILRLTARFKFLAKASYETRTIAHSLLGKYGIYFGVRVVAGIFMPVAYIVYGMFSNIGFLQGVGALIIIGEFLERLLFVYISENSKAKNEQISG